jgi:acyl-coenzyme A thioesterase PaaI-like protein
MKRELSVSWQDPAALAQAGRSKSGIDFLRAIRDGLLPLPPMAELLGFKLVEVDPGHAVFEVLPGEQHYNPIGVVQTQMPAGGGYTTLEAKTNLIRAVTSHTGRLRGIGTRPRPASC